ncbi:MAG: PRD domain-containing protein [Anaerolineae bacterium]|nr:PRD domain-containing protein [Anaerolineae bacterium]
MVSLTIQQRNLLYQLLNSKSPVVIADLAGQMNLTARQVNYRFKPIKVWLEQRDVMLKATPGIGVSIDCSADERLKLLRELDAQANFHLILTPGQRQQLFALNLLTTNEPVILDWLQHVAAVSRTTIFKDLEPVEAWAQRFELDLIRRPNYGMLFDGSEMARRQALAALLWGDIPFPDPLSQMTHDRGLVFSLADDATFLPIVQQADRLLRQWHTDSALDSVAYAEAQLGGRFTDDAVLHLALALATQVQRLRAGHMIEAEPVTVTWLQSQKVWPVAEEMLQSLVPDQPAEAAEVAAIAMHLLAGTRSQLWPGALEIEPELTELVAALMAEVAQAFSTPGLRHDTALRDGLVAHIIPAYMRQHFGLWTPPSWSDGALLTQYHREYAIARELALVVTERTGVILPDGEIDTLTMLLRAAFIRERPNHPKRAFIICPSGMATAQLLVARLKARFPSLDILGVLSLRELSPEHVAGAQLLITTVPLLKPPRPGLPVIEVHPLLMPEDIETITHWLT